MIDNPLIIEPQCQYLENQRPEYNLLSKFIHFMRNRTRISIKNSLVELPWKNKVQEDQEVNSNTSSTKPSITYKRGATKLTILELNDKMIIRFLSRAHHIFNLRFDTIFLAYEILRNYRKADSTEQGSMDVHILAAVCLKLSMNYEEVYPPGLQEISAALRKEIPLPVYLKAEEFMLRTLDYNLKTLSPKMFLSDKLERMSVSSHHQIFYMLELAYYSQEIISLYSLEEICASILYIGSPLLQSFCPVGSFREVKWRTVEQCSKKLMMTRVHASSKYPDLFKKYQHDKYSSVSEKSIQW